MFELATRRSRGILAVFLVAVCAMAVVLAVPRAVDAAPSEQAKPMTHPVDGRENCTMCHLPSGGVKPMPADHVGRTNQMCSACHTPPAASQPAAAPAAAPAAPAQAAPAQAAPAAPAPAKAAPPAQAASPMQPATQPAAAQPAASQSQPKIDPEASTKGCRACHNRPEFATVAEVQVRPDTTKQVETDRMYAHRSIACVTCHTGDPHKNPTPVTKNSIAEACGKCHVTERIEHESSVHGKSLAAGGKDAATCVDCHSTQGTPHSITRVLSPDSPVYRGSIASTCAKCHAKNEVMGRYDVPTEVYKTYMTTFHGKANVLSPYEITQHPKATCINCHGYHDIKAQDDPTSPVAKANLATTCGTCHPGAGDQFAAGWLGHKEATPEQFPVVYFAERFFFFFTSSVLTFGFIFMVALELGSWILRRKPTQH
ncbi:MAG TPA: cytochrome c3 family protein [Chloroflexota bacterium]